MNRFQSIALTAIACSISAAAAFAAGPLAPIDTEQRAASALINVLDNSGRAQGVIAVIAADSAPFAMEVFKKLNAAAITAPALRNMPAGTTQSCVNGGSFNVRMPRSLPRVLNIEWTNCQVIRWDPNTVATGQGQITLFSDNFRPEHVLAIRLGNASRDLVMTMNSADSDGVSQTVRTRNVRMTGLIPVFIPDYDVDSYTGSAYEISGFLRDVSDTDYFDPGRQDYHYETFNSAENAAVMGVIANLQQGLYYDEDQRLLWGKLTSTQVDPYWGTLTFRIGVENLAVRRIIDYGAWNHSLSIDGTMEVQWPKEGRAGELDGCRDGRFSVRTVTPVFTPEMNVNVIDSGELRINGVATARYYSAATVPPNLPVPANGTLLNMTVRNVGTFNYDQNAFPSPLLAAAACP